jgi:hypothetical protein
VIVGASDLPILCLTMHRKCPAIVTHDSSVAVQNPKGGEINPPPTLVFKAVAHPFEVIRGYSVHPSNKIVGNIPAHLEDRSGKALATASLVHKWSMNLSIARGFAYE